MTSPAYLPFGSAIVSEDDGRSMLASKRPRAAQGTSGHILPAGIPDYEKNPRLANMRERILAYRVAERHPAVQAGRLVWEMAILAASWRVVPASDDPDDIARAEHIARNLGIKTESLGQDPPSAVLGRPWEQTLLQLLPSQLYGWQWWEMVCEDVDGVRYTHLLWRDPASTYAFVQDTFDRLVAIRQLPVTGYGGMRTIEAGRFVLLGRGQAGSNWDGVGMLRGIEPLCVDANSAANALGVAVQRTGTPTPYVQIDEVRAAAAGLSPDQIRQEIETWGVYAQNYIAGERQGIASGGWVDWSVFDAGGPGGLDHLVSTLDAYDRRILQAFLAQFLQLGASGSGGSYSLGEVHADIAQQAAEQTCQTIAEQLAWFVECSLRWQFGSADPGRLPRLVPEGNRSPLWLEHLSELTSLASQGMLTPDDSMAEELRRGLQFESLEPRRSTAQRIGGRAALETLPSRMRGEAPSTKDNAQ